MSEAIRADGVRVVYPDGTKAVDGVDLRVPKGEFFGFLARTVPERRRPSGRS